ncbi:MAG TPA: hypothetical protein VF479_06500 [Pseudolysinimonas sp.]
MRARVAASAGVAALVAMVLAGCNFITPQQTLVPYDPSDGVSAAVGDVDVLNAVILSDDGVSGNLVFTALNSSTDDVDLIVQFESEGDKVTLDLDVAAGSSTEFGFGEGGQLFLAGIDTQPGGLLPVYFQYGAEQGRQLLVPVLDGALEQYAPLLPTPTPTPTPTILPTPTPTPTPGS